MSFYLYSGIIMTVPEIVELIKEAEREVWRQRGMTAFELRELTAAAENLLDAMLLVVVPLNESDDGGDGDSESGGSVVSIEDDGGNEYESNIYIFPTN